MLLLRKNLGSCSLPQKGFARAQKNLQDVPYKSPSSQLIVTVTISYIGSVHGPMLPVTELVVIMVQ